MRRLILAKATPGHRAIGGSRWLLAATFLACTAISCEDGPNQTYAPPPANANWNDGRFDGGVTPGTATNATAPFALPDGGAISSGGNNANEICTQQQIAAVTPLIHTAPIVPPNAAARLNLAGVDDAGNVIWTGLTAEAAEAINCQGNSETDVFGYGADYLDVYWDNGSVLIQYYVPTHKVDQLSIFAPYGGTMTATSLDGSTTYVISVEGTVPISVTNTSGANSTLNLDWVGASNGVPSSVKVFDDLYRAIMATFFPTYPVEPANITCNQTGACILGIFPAYAVAYFSIPALEWDMWAGPYYTTIGANAINRMDLNFAQIMNYSPANPVLKLDATGPTSIPLQLAAAGTPPCQLTLGMSYSDFLNNCVLTSTSQAANQSELRELYSDFSHDEETFAFDISGVDLSFADTRLTPTTVVVDPPVNGGCAGMPSDPACPQAPDTAFEFTIDQSTLSLIANDWTYDQNGNPTLHDLHGAGAMYDDYRTLAIQNLEAEVCANVLIGGSSGSIGSTGSIGSIGTTGGASGTTSGATTSGSSTTSGNATTSGGSGSNATTSGGSTTSGAFQGTTSGGPILSPLQVECAAWATNPLTAQIQSCIAPRDPGSGALLGDPTLFQATGCTGMETLISSDLTTPDDPVNVGPIASQINPTYTLGMKMGHQQGSWCVDAMSRNQIAAQSFTVTCPSAAQSCPPPISPAFTQLCPGGVGSCLTPGGNPFSCAAGTCDPTTNICSIGTPTCTTTPGTNLTPLTVAQIDLIGEVGVGAYLGNPTNVTPPQPAPAGTEVVLALPYVCSADNLLPLSHVQAVNALGGGNVANLPIDIQDNRFFFKMYGFALIQTMEATNESGGLTAPVSAWGPPALGSLMPVRINDLFFDSSGDGQFETFEYVDRRFVCPDGANDCAPAGSTSFTCPQGSCQPPFSSCAGPGVLTCNSGETAQAPLDINFTADVKNGIMNDYDFNRYMYRGETALYQIMQPPGYALGQASNALITNMFGSPLLTSFGGLPPGLVDLTGEPIDPNDYVGAYGGAPTPLSLSYSQQGDSALSVVQTFPGPQQAQVSYPYNGVTTDVLLPWSPNQPGSGFDEAEQGNSALDYFVQSASIDFSGVTTSALLDYNIVGGVESLSAESTDFLGDVFMCYEPFATPPLLAVRMYTPTLAVLNWLNQPLPGGANPYTDCGIVVRWSPYDNYVNLIESTTNGVRLQVTQGGGLGRVVGATLYVPGLQNFEE